MFIEKETNYIKEEISKCEDVEDLKKEILPLLEKQQDAWKRKIAEIIHESGYKKQEFAKLCGVSRVTVNKWENGSIPKNRETFIKIGMVAGYNQEKMNQLLQRYGRYPALYSKSLEDCICIFVINHNYGKETINKYLYILDKIKENILRDESVETVENISTVKFDKKLAIVDDEEELEQFISNNIAMFANAYHKFYAYVNAFIKATYEELDFVHSVSGMAEDQGWSSSLKQCVSAIRQNKWYPTRTKIISLGLHLSMNHEQMNNMLALAHMEPLCAKNIFESVIMFILEDASLNNIIDTESGYYDPYDLCNFAREILDKLELPEIEDFIQELPEE